MTTAREPAGRAVLVIVHGSGIALASHDAGARVIVAGRSVEKPQAIYPGRARYRLRLRRRHQQFLDRRVR